MITESIARKVLEVVDAGLVNGVGEPIPGQMCVEAAVCYALGLPHGDDPKCVAQSLRKLKIRLNDSSWSSDKARGAGMRRLAVAQLGSAGELDEKEFVRRVVDYAIRVSTPKALRAAASIHKDAGHRAKLIAAANKCESKGSPSSAREAQATAADAATAAYAATAASASADATASAATAASASAANAAAYAYAANYAAAAAYAAAYAYAADATAATAADAAYVADATAATAAYAADARDKALAEYAEAVVQILIEMKAPGCQWLFLTEPQS